MALEGGLVPVDEVEEAGVVGKVFEDGGKARGFGAGGVFGPSHLEVEARFLDRPSAHLTPVRDGHPFHEASFNWRTGLDFSSDRGEKLLEEFFRFAFEDDGLGEHAVTEAVSSRGLFAFGSYGASGAGSVDSGGLGFEFCSHTTAA